MKQQSGFTLIELIAVIVILGILAATALPKFVDLSDAAEDAAVRGVAGALGSASALNHANNIAEQARLTITSPIISVASCDNVKGALDGGLPSTDYVITDGAAIAGGGVGTEGGSTTCIVTYRGKIGNFVGYGAVPGITP